MNQYRTASINEKINAKGNSVNNDCPLRLKEMYKSYGMSTWGLGLYKVKPDKCVNSNWK